MGGCKQPGFGARAAPFMISVHALRKHYRVHQRKAGLTAALRSVFSRPQSLVKAVDGIDFTIPTGARVGFLGPNGAGKTTTLKVLAGLLHPTSGEVSVNGHEPRRREDAFLKQIMLVMGQKQQLIWDLPPAETFELNRAIYGVPMAEFKKTLVELDEALELGALVRKPTRQLSLGERMKCEMAAALIHRPSVLFLDEPTIGLDVQMQVAMREFIRRYNEQTGATLILTSHDMDDVSALCPRVIVIDKGTLSYDGGLDQLVQQVRPEKRLVLQFSEEVSEEALAQLGRVVTHASHRAVLQVEQAKVNRTVTQALSTLPVQDLTVENAPLEEVMSELFSRSRGEREAEAQVTA